MGLVMRGPAQARRLQRRCPHLGFCDGRAEAASRAPVEQGGWSVIPIVWNGIDLVNPLVQSGGVAKLQGVQSGLVLRHGPDRTVAPLRDGGRRGGAKDLAAQLQAGFHRNVNYVLGGQYSAPGGLPVRPEGRDPVRLPGVLEHRLGLTQRPARRAYCTANLDKISVIDHKKVCCVLVARFDVLVGGPLSAERTS